MMKTMIVVPLVALLAVSCGGGGSGTEVEPQPEDGLNPLEGSSTGDGGLNPDFVPAPEGMTAPSSDPVSPPVPPQEQLSMQEQPTAPDDTSEPVFEQPTAPESTPELAPEQPAAPENTPELAPEQPAAPDENTSELAPEQPAAPDENTSELAPEDLPASEATSDAVPAHPSATAATQKDPAIDQTAASGAAPESPQGLAPFLVEDAATFLALPWRDVASTATAALDSSQFSRIDWEFFASISSAELSAAGSGEAIACPLGGTFSSTNSISGSQTFGRGTRYMSSSIFDSCKTEKHELNGFITTARENGSVQYVTRNTDIREYEISGVAEDSAIVLEGSVVTREEHNSASVCGVAQTSTTTSANFSNIRTGPLFDSYSLHALSLSRGESVNSVGQLSQGTCEQVRSIGFDDSARISFNTDSESLFDVVRSGSLRKGLASDTAVNEPLTARLVISAMDGSSDSLQIQTSGVADEVTVTIQESNAVISFQSTWDFGEK